MNAQNPVEQFESMMEQLQAQVALLELETLSLSEAIDAYERSVELANGCHRLLDEAELRIQKIDASSRAVQEAGASYRFADIDAARLLLGDDEADLLDLIDDE
ncbi:MAG TPA: exodeoxyribonuclease VII small subunit [Thermomicrobiales bacterium]|nr:exodeoxyribonuclease VII small subunit [Thermomicrobiales bacterium]